MNFRRLLILPILCAVAASIAQTTPTRLVPLPMDPPEGTLTSLPVGSLPGAQILHLTVCLPYGDSTGIQAFVDSVSDPKSSTYRQFITPDEVGRRFGLPSAAVQKVANYLTSQGMKIRLVASNRLSILVVATVAQVESAFHTSVEQFLDLKATAGPALYSFTSPPSVPAEIGPYVGYIDGLETFSRPTPLGEFAVSPTQLRTFYNVTPMFGGGSQGQGRTVGISNFDGYRLANIAPWYAKWGLPTPAAGMGKNITIEVPNGDTTGSGAVETGAEGDLDMQCVLAMAPLCNLIIYDGGDAGGLLSVLTLEANDNKADIITQSYHWKGSASFYLSAHNEHVSMSAQGITCTNGSGDDGATGLATGPYPRFDPEVLLVGGTTTETADLGGALTSQTGWGYVQNGAQVGSGGGWIVNTETFNTLPSWQKGTGIPTNVNYRLSPDVALNADPHTPYYTYLQAGNYGKFTITTTGLYSFIGGTSGASPTFAGCLAVTEQQIIANGGLPANSAGKHRFGRIQDLLYSFNGDSSIFTDITSGSNGTLPNGQASKAGAGWDFVTGWGVMNFQAFALRESPKVTGLVVTPASVLGGSTTAVTGTVTISSAAPTGGTTVTLSSSAPTAASVPATVTVLAGSTTAKFSVTSYAVSVAKSVVISAAAGGQTKTASLSVTPATLSALTLSGSSAYGAQSVTGTVTITAKAPTGGIKVPISTSNIAVTSLSTVSVTVAAGATTATFKVTAIADNASTLVTITATLGTAKTAKLTVLPAVLASAAVSPTTILGGVVNSTATFTLNSPAGPAGTSVKISAAPSTAAKFAASTIVVPAGKTSVTATLTSLAVTANATVTVSGTTASVTKSATLTVQAATLTALALSPTTVQGGSSTVVTGTVTLNGPAPTAGRVVTLSSSNTSAATTPATVTVPSGKKSVAFTVTTKKVSATTAVILRATLGSVISPKTLTVTH